MLPARDIAASIIGEISGRRTGRIQAAIHGEHKAGAESTRILGSGEASLDSGRGSTLTVSVLCGLLRTAHWEWKTQRRCVRIVPHVPLQHRERLIDLVVFLYFLHRWIR